MIFEEKRFVIANILIKTPENITGGGNIMAIQLSKDKLFDFINYKEYKIINDTDNLKSGIYTQIINRPFKDSDKTISTKIFREKEFKEIIRRFEIQQKEVDKYLENIDNIDHMCPLEDISSIKEEQPKKKIFNKKLP